MRQPRQNKSLVNVGIIIVLIISVRLVSVIVPNRTGSVDPRVNMGDDQTQQIAQRRQQQQAGAFIAVADGEVSRTEERIREATALGTAASLFVVSESLNGRAPASVTALLVGLNRMELMPPGVKLLDARGNIACSHGTLFVRYRPEPLGIEVISLGKVRLDGPAVLVRVPENRNSVTSEEAAGLFLATRLDDVSVPAPFASEADVIAHGFAPEPLRAAKLPKL